MPQQRTKLLILGIILCASGFLLSLSSLSITVYNYQHSNENSLRFERTIIEIVAQMCIIIGFALIYTDLIMGLKELKLW
jgi:hypothetical protein